MSCLLTDTFSKKKNWKKGYFVSLLVVPKYISLFLWKHGSREDCWVSNSGTGWGLSGQALLCLSASESMLPFWGPKQYFWLWKIQDLFCVLQFMTDLNHCCFMSLDPYFHCYCSIAETQTQLLYLITGFYQQNQCELEYRTTRGESDPVLSFKISKPKCFPFFKLY